MTEHILSMLGLALKAGRVEVGEEPVGAAARAKKARVIFVAQDAAPSSVRRAQSFARTGSTLCVTLPAGKDTLGSSLGRTSVAMCAVTDIGFAESLVKKLAALDSETYQDAADTLAVKAKRARERKEEQLRREEEERLKEQRFREQWLAERAAGRQARREARKQRNRLLPLLSVKTNLYTWAGMTPDFDYTAFTPNLSAEFFFARRWSAVASAAYADWDYDSGKCHWGVSAYSLEPRFWVNGDGCYRWCYVGIYGQLGDFDNRSVDSGRIAGGTANCTGTYWEGGLSVGCYILLDAHWGIEAGLRGGYRASDANAYDVEMPYYYFNRNFRENHFGVTGVNISISYRFGSRK